MFLRGRRHFPRRFASAAPLPPLTGYGRYSVVSSKASSVVIPSETALFHLKYAPTSFLDLGIFQIRNQTESQSREPHMAPNNTFGPVGCGIPPTGSTVTANAFACVFAATSAVHMLPQAFPPGPIKPALIGAPFAGTSHI